MLKIACSTGIRSSKSLDEACKHIKNLGFTYVDPLAIEAWHIKPSRLLQAAAREAERARQTLNTYHLQCVALNLGFLHNFTTCTDAEHQTNLKVIRAAVVLAQVLDVTIVTTSPGSGSGADRGATLDRLATRFNEAIAVGAAAGLTIAVETHAGALLVQPDAARAMIDRCPGLKLTYDPSHYIAEQIPIEETLDLLPHAAHIHLRNARIGHFQERMATGLLDMPWMIDQIVASGYQGAIAIEYIEDCGALAEGYRTEDEIVALQQILLAKGLRC